MLGLEPLRLRSTRNRNQRKKYFGSRRFLVGTRLVVRKVRHGLMDQGFQRQLVPIAIFFDEASHESGRKYDVTPARRMT